MNECSKTHFHFYTNFPDKLNTPPYRVIKCAHDEKRDDQLVMLQVISSWLQTSVADELQPMNLIDSWENGPSTYVLCYVGPSDGYDRRITAWQRTTLEKAEASWNNSELHFLGKNTIPYGSS